VREREAIIASTARLAKRILLVGKSSFDDDLPAGR
jgi:hypothetical protein